MRTTLWMLSALCMACGPKASAGTETTAPADQAQASGAVAQAAPGTPRMVDAPAPELDKQPLPPPQPPLSVLSASARVPARPYLRKLRDAARVKLGSTWVEVTKPGASPRVEVKYTATTERPTFELRGRVLTTTLPVAYHATVRARVRPPVGYGWIWITRGTEWGTKAAPHRLEIQLETVLDITDDWHVDTLTRLRELKFAKVPDGQVCLKNKVLKVCIPKANAARFVHKQLDATLRTQLQRELPKIDQRAREYIGLRERVQWFWDRMGCPLDPANKQFACEAPAANAPRWWVQVRPEGAQLEFSPRVTSNLSFELGLQGRPRLVYGPWPGLTQSPLPGRSPTGPQEFQVGLQLDVPFEQVGVWLERDAAGRSFDLGGGLRTTVKSARVHGYDVHDGAYRIVLEAQLEGDLAGTVFLHGSPVYEAATRSLVLTNFDYTLKAASALQQLVDATQHEALRRGLEKRMRWDMTQRMREARERATESLNLRVEDVGTLIARIRTLNIEHITATDQGVTLWVSARGNALLSFFNRK